MGQTWGSRTHSTSQFGGDFCYFTESAGGGVDFVLNRWLAIRAQADLLHVGSPGNVARISTGLVVRF
jgi:hypothetical protein